MEGNEGLFYQAAFVSRLAWSLSSVSKAAGLKSEASGFKPVSVPKNFAFVKLLHFLQQTVLNVG